MLGSDLDTAWVLLFNTAPPNPRKTPACCCQEEGRSLQGRGMAFLPSGIFHSPCLGRAALGCWTLVAMAPHAHSHDEDILPNGGRRCGKRKSIGRLPHVLRAQECWEALGHTELVRGSPPWSTPLSVFDHWSLTLEEILGKERFHSFKCLY